MKLRLLKILLLISFCLIIYKNEQYSLFLSLMILLEVSNFYFYSVIAIVGLILLLLNLSSTGRFRSSVYFFISCMLLVVYLLPYFEHYKRIINYSPSLITFSIFFLLLIVSFIAELKKTDIFKKRKV